MRFYEHESKTLLARQGIAVPTGRLAHSAAEAAAAAVGIGLPVALKAQVLSGGRMKAGGIRFAETRTRRGPAAGAILGLEMAGRQPQGVLIEARVAVAPGVLPGHHLRHARQAAGGHRLRPRRHRHRGGGGAGAGARRSPAPSPRCSRSPSSPSATAVAALGIAGGELASLADVLHRLAQLFLTHDLTLAEINPLAVVTDGSVVALDCHLEMEDEAVARQRRCWTNWASTRAAARPASRRLFERRAAEIDQMDHRGVAGRVVEFDGDLGLIIGGGGASLAAFDAVRRHGGRPANYCEIGGNPSVRKVAELTRHILGKPGVERLAVIMNVVNNTRVDLVARGVIKGCLEAGRDPAEAVAVFRIPGAWEEEGFRLLRHYGIEPLGREVSIDEAARRAVHGR